MPVCKTCKIDKQDSSFGILYVSKNRKGSCRDCCSDKRRASCGPKQKAYRKEWREKNLDRMRSKQRLWDAANKERRCAYSHKAILRRKYNLTPESLLAMFEKQEYKCAVCGDPIAREKHKYNVDHCHITGNVRGILCSLCNRGLGLFRDSASHLLAAKNYIEEHHGHA